MAVRRSGRTITVDIVETAVPTSDHYAEAFSTLPGRCFRLVHTGTGHAQHCPEAVTRSGEFTDNVGGCWTVDACAGHAGELQTPRQLSGRTVRE